jgi:hypothetical protein
VIGLLGRGRPDRHAPIASAMGWVFASLGSAMGWLHDGRSVTPQFSGRAPRQLEDCADYARLASEKSRRCFPYASQPTFLGSIASYRLN